MERDVGREGGRVTCSAVPFPFCQQVCALLMTMPWRSLLMLRSSSPLFFPLLLCLSPGHDLLLSQLWSSLITYWWLLTIMNTSPFSFSSFSLLQKPNGEPVKSAHLHRAWTGAKLFPWLWKWAQLVPFPSALPSSASLSHFSSSVSLAAPAGQGSDYSAIVSSTIPLFLNWAELMIDFSKLLKFIHFTPSWRKIVLTFDLY